jgi:hypothetical protein
MSEDNKIQFSQEERDRVANFWNSEKKAGRTPSLGDIVSFFTSGKITDPRTSEGKRVRAIISALEFKPVKTEWKKEEGKTFIILSDIDKEFIRNNCENNKVYQMAIVLFPPAPGERLQPLGKEVRAINKYLEEIGHLVKKVDEPKMAEGKYEAPDKFHTVLAKINLYLHQELSTHSMSNYEKKCIETTKQFLHAPRFVQEMNSYSTVEKRVSLEGDFIRSVYFKPDANPEEISMIVTWCADNIEVTDSKRQAEKLKNLLEDIAEDRDGKISMSLVESINNINTHISEVLRRQERVYALLNKARSKRDEERGNKTTSVAALFEAFREEENRKKAVRQAELIKEGRKNEVKRMETLSDTILLCLGLSSEEI